MMLNKLLTFLTPSVIFVLQVIGDTSKPTFFVSGTWNDIRTHGPCVPTCYINYLKANLLMRTSDVEENHTEQDEH